MILSVGRYELVRVGMGCCAVFYVLPCLDVSERCVCVCVEKKTEGDRERDKTADNFLCPRGILSHTLTRR